MAANLVRVAADLKDQGGELTPVTRAKPPDVQMEVVRRLSNLAEEYCRKAKEAEAMAEVAQDQTAKELH